MSSLHGGKQCTHTQSIPEAGQLVFFCFAFWRCSFIQGKICLVMTWVAVLEPVVLGDFFFCVELLLGLGELAAKGAACCSLILSVWLLPWLALGRIQLPLMSPFLCAGGRTDVVWMGHIGF